MRCRSYPKITKILITTLNTPSSTKRMTANSRRLTARTTGSNLRASNLPLCKGTQDGKRAANFSLLFGFLSPLSFVLGFWLLVQGLGESGLQVALAAPVLNILGIWQGWVAQRHGVPALAGRILNWLGLCFFIGIAALFMYIANALSQIN